MQGRSGVTRERRILTEGGGLRRDEARRLEIDRLSLVDAQSAAAPGEDELFAFVEADLGKNGESLKKLRKSRGGWGNDKAEGEKGTYAWAESNLDGLVRGHLQAPPFYGRPSFGQEERDLLRPALVCSRPEHVFRGH